MGQIVRCPHCGGDVPIPDAPRAASLWRRATPGVVILAVGGLLVLSSAIMVASVVWDDMASSGRLAMLAVTNASLYAVGLRFRRTWPDGLPTLIVLFVATALVPFTAALGAEACFSPGLSAGQRYGAHPTELQTAGAMLVALVVQLTTLAYALKPALTVAPACTFVWMTLMLAEGLWRGRAGGGSVTSLSVALSGIILMSGAAALARRSRPAMGGPAGAVGALATMFGLTVLGAEHRTWDALAIVGPLTLIALSCRTRSLTHLLVGALFLVINVFRIGTDRFGSSIGMPLVVLVCGIVSMAAGYAVHRIRREYMSDG